MKRLMLILLTMFMTLSMATYAWATGPKIVLDGLELRSVVAPYQTEGRTMVPLRVISENMNAVVDWDSETKKIKVEQDEKTVVLTLGSDQALVNGEVHLLDVPATSISGRTFVPLRFVSEMLACTVDYKDGVVTVTSPDDGSMAYLLQAREAYLKAESVKYNGGLDGNIKISTGGVIQTDIMKIDVSGWFKNPDQFYTYTNVYMTGESQVTRMYFDGKNTYLRQGDDSWTDASDSLTQFGVDSMQLSLFAQNPGETIELIKKLGMHTRFAADEKINNQDCKVISYVMNKEHYTNAWRASMEELIKSDPDLYQMLTEEDQHEMMQGDMLELMQNFNQTVKLYFAKDSKLLVHEVTNVEMTMAGTQSGDSMEIKLGGTINFTDYNGPISPPDVAGAVKAPLVN